MRVIWEDVGSGSNHPIILDCFSASREQSCEHCGLGRRSCSHLTGNLLFLSLWIVFLVDWRIAKSCPQDRGIAN